MFVLKVKQTWSWFTAQPAKTPVCALNVAVISLGLTMLVYNNCFVN